ncbi:MAG: LicD family protein [Firmicutes bacterium]|nr:LicD family protein [Bacillota bacterium]
MSKKTAPQIIHLNESQKEKLKQCQLQMLDAVVDICEKHNLTYVLLGGTCLGAVRHKGYIPWDDDIDIGLPRDDYDKLVKIANEVLPENMFFQTFENEKEYPLLFAKVRLNDTYFHQEIVSQLEMHHGIYIDIFPLDGCGDLLNKAKKHLQKIRFYRRIVGGKILAKQNQSTLSKYKIKMFLAKIATPFFSASRAYKKAQKSFYKYTFKESSYIGNILGAWGEKEIAKKEVMFGENMQTTQIEFEGKIYNAPYDTHAYLISLYGDYMTPPPPEKRISHHDIITIQFPKEMEEIKDKGLSK